MKPLFSLFRFVRQFLPKHLRAWLNRWAYFPGYEVFLRANLNPYRDDPPTRLYPESKYLFGIIEEFYQLHRHYVAACRELNQSYQVIKISGPDWIEIVRDSGCDAFLAWPSTGLRVWRRMFDDRLKIIEEDLSKPVYPTGKEIWLFDNKRRTRDWLVANHIPHPKTWVFYDYNQALAFIRSAELPLVHKTNYSASASGVTILRDKAQARRLVSRAFKRGIIPRGKTPVDRQWAVVFFQEYLAEVREWRMVRIGDSYFGHRNERRGDFHSGTLLKAWDDPAPELLKLVHALTERGGFTSMNVEVFETPEGRLLVNELHTVFGQSTRDLMRVEGRPGRYLFLPEENEWRFEEGDFTRNACANLRVSYLRDHFLPKRHFPMA